MKHDECICSRHRSHQGCSGECSCLRPDPKFKQPAGEEEADRDLAALERMVQRLRPLYRRAHQFAYAGGSSSGFEARVKMGTTHPTEDVALDTRRMGVRSRLSSAWDLLDSAIGDVREAERQIVAAYGGTVKRNRDGSPLRGPGMKEEEGFPKTVKTKEFEKYQEAQRRREANEAGL